MQSHGNCIMGSYHDSLNQIQINQVFLQFRLSWSLCNRSNMSLGGCDYKFVQNEDIKPLHQLKLICSVLLIYSGLLKSHEPFCQSHSTLLFKVSLLY